MHINESIFGIKFDVLGKELVKHCEERCLYHDGRKKFYEAQEIKFKDEMDELAKANPSYSNKTTLSNMERMSESKAHHSARSRFFAFSTLHLLSDHYKMTREELVLFEFISGT
jgi:hypothetical protein